MTFVLKQFEDNTVGLIINTNNNQTLLPHKNTTVNITLIATDQSQFGIQPKTLIDTTLIIGTNVTKDTINSTQWRSVSEKWTITSANTGIKLDAIGQTTKLWDHTGLIIVLKSKNNIKLELVYKKGTDVVVMNTFTLDPYVKFDDKDDTFSMNNLNLLVESLHGRLKYYLTATIVQQLAKNMSKYLETRTDIPSITTYLWKLVNESVKTMNDLQIPLIVNDSIGITSVNALRDYQILLTTMVNKYPTRLGSFDNILSYTKEMLTVSTVHVNLSKNLLDEAMKQLDSIDQSLIASLVNDIIVDIHAKVSNLSSLPILLAETNDIIAQIVVAMENVKSAIIDQGKQNIDSIVRRISQLLSEQSLIIVASEKEQFGLLNDQIAELAKGTALEEKDLSLLNTKFLMIESELRAIRNYLLDINKSILKINSTSGFSNDLPSYDALPLRFLASTKNQVYGVSSDNPFSPSNTSHITQIKLDNGISVKSCTGELLAYGDYLVTDDSTVLTRFVPYIEVRLFEDLTIRLWYLAALQSDFSSYVKSAVFYGSFSNTPILLSN